MWGVFNVRIMRIRLSSTDGRDKQALHAGVEFASVQKVDKKQVRPLVMRRSETSGKFCVFAVWPMASWRQASQKRISCCVKNTDENEYITLIATQTALVRVTSVVCTCQQQR